VNSLPLIAMLVPIIVLIVVLVAIPQKPISGKHPLSPKQKRLFIVAVVLIPAGAMLIPMIAFANATGIVSGYLGAAAIGLGMAFLIRLAIPDSDQSAV